ncbi:MAG: metallopeptidase family protein [Nitrospirae bacterium]|nr:metallopeptidase family protein [Nitrospirota bacterium]
MDRPEFEILVQNSLIKLPQKFKKKLANISVEVEDLPSHELLNDMGIRSGTLLGLYQGVPLTKRGWNYGNMLPDRIVIYQRTIESVAKSPEEIEKVVLDTVIHEIGHYFGFTDKELREIEIAKRKQESGK